eukprot:622438-Rhodomonas_salina.1
MGGYTVYFNKCFISWAHNLQKLVTLSMCESEYVQMTLTIKDMLFHKEKLEYLGYKQGRSLLYCYNEASIALADDPVHRG